MLLNQYLLFNQVSQWQFTRDKVRHSYVSVYKLCQMLKVSLEFLQHWRLCSTLYNLEKDLFLNTEYMPAQRITLLWYSPVGPALRSWWHGEAESRTREPFLCFSFSTLVNLPPVPFFPPWLRVQKWNWQSLVELEWGNQVCLFCFCLQMVGFWLSPLSFWQNFRVELGIEFVANRSGSGHSLF